MWLPLKYSYSRNKSVAAIAKGDYDNIRLMAGDSQHSNAFPWMTTKQAIANGNESSPEYTLFDFSAACYYFAEGLTDLMKSDETHRDKNSTVGAEGAVVPLGLINTAIGGSMIEEWTLNGTTDTCTNTSRGAHDQTLYDKNVLPYLSMTVKGFLVSVALHTVLHTVLHTILHTILH
jgi:hypothetical protein